MLLEIWNSFVQFIKSFGNNTLVVNLTMLILGAVLLKLFPKIWSGFIGFITLLTKKIGKGAKDREFEKGYLDWLIGQYNYLGLLPAQIIARRWGDRQQFVELESVYVQLSVSSRSDDVSWAKTYKNDRDRWRKVPWYLAWLPTIINAKVFIPYEPEELGLVIDRHKRLVVRGDPGSGKTTLMRYLAVTCARARRRAKEAGDSKNLVNERLSWNNHPLPIMVRMRRHGNVGSWKDDKELIDTFYHEMPPELRKRCPNEFFERHLKKGNCLILLDGFDELGSPETRVLMARRIASFLQIYNRPDNRIIVTTRIVGYEGQLDRYDFVVRSVKNLEAGEIRALVKQRYEAIAVAESVGRPPQEAKILTRKLSQREKRLIEKIEETPRLSQLATNPMLLSLIVLVHFLKIELPEERILLYRDCVEILTERWQQVRNQEAELEKTELNELTLHQKLILLREIAFKMQQQRKDEKNQSLLPRSLVQELIAGRLPDFLGGSLPESESKRKEICDLRAEEWMNSIEVESGILVEQGLDEAGEPLIGFSHLTFQEYLAAVAIYEVEKYQPLLWENLLNPAWREVVLLYEALVDDATPVIECLLESSTIFDAIITAGYCLAERVKRVKSEIQRQVLKQLQESFVQADDATIYEFGKVMATIGGRELASFMRQQLNNPSRTKQLAAISSLGRIQIDNLEIENVRNDLLHITESFSDVEIVVKAREALAQIGDPRFINIEPVLIRIPKQIPGVTPSLRGWKEIFSLPPLKGTNSFKKKIFHIFEAVQNLGRAMDFMVFVNWHPFWRKQSKCYEFEISKFPITNFEYSRFVAEDDHQPPSNWIVGAYPLSEATNPVTGITRQDADAYCQWLSRETRKTFRLPREWEWEWAASGTEKKQYPWGNEFDKERCNTDESELLKTTPVGSYKEGDSLYGVSDMVGNVWEMTHTRLLSDIIKRIFSTVFSLFGIFLLIILLIVSLSIYFSSNNEIFHYLFFKIGLPSNSSGMKGVQKDYINFISSIHKGFAYILYIIVNLYFATTIIYTIIDDLIIIRVWKRKYQTVLRGGSYNSPSTEATCFHRGKLYESSSKGKDCGFRCVREL